MRFEYFELLFNKLVTTAQIGNKAHFEAAPYRSAVQNTETINNAKAAAVLLLVYPAKHQSYFALIKRPTYQGAHSNQIALPGGKVEVQDKSLLETAIREASEEVNIKPDSVLKTTPLTPIYIPPSNFLVTPFLGISLSKPLFVKEEREVDEILEVNLHELLQHNKLPQTSIQTSSNTAINSPYLKLQNQVVWGATAMILNEFKHLLKSVL